ncbi:MAG: DUF2933 domain-containing protein [Betaproteobacteria bacterium]|nr:DUF2933 domain-containing protein [Betaproteobacteria bacterium]
MTREHDTHRGSTWSSKANWALIGFVLVAAYFLITGHRAHAIEFLPFALVLACPLLHLFMHRGHGHGANRDQQQHRHGDRHE